MPDDQRPAALVDGRLGPRADDDLRPDAGRVAQGDCNQRTPCFHGMYCIFYARLARGLCRDCKSPNIVPSVQGIRD